MSAQRRVVLAAGGTGGHMFPAEALAGELIARGCRVALITDRRGRGFADRLPAVETHRISAGGLAGSGLWRRARSALELAVGLFQARGLIHRLAPQVAIGFGGYASVPTMLAAHRAGLPTILHEQNAVLGRANRLLAGRATRVATSFATMPGASLDSGKVVVTGNPVRSAVAAVGNLPYPTLDADAPVRLLILGGSQGARVFSRVVPAAVALLPQGLRARLRLAQQCRPEDLEAVRAAYERLGVPAELATFFDDMPRHLAAAHLAIARAGASTVAELAAAGRPAILVPFPFAADDHQAANARCASETGGAWPMPEPTFAAEALAMRLQSLIAAPDTLIRAAAAARAAGRRDAATRLADLVGALAPCDRATVGRAAADRREAAA